MLALQFGLLVSLFCLSQEQARIRVPLLSLSYRGSSGPSARFQFNQLPTTAALNQVPNAAAINQLSNAAGFKHLSFGAGLNKLPTAAGFNQLPTAAGVNQLPTATGFNQLPTAAGLNQPSAAAAFNQLPTAAGLNQLPTAAGLNQPPAAAPIKQPPTVPVTVTSNAENILQQEWVNFKVNFNKVYSSAHEEAHRREIFIENRAKIILFDEEYAQGLRDFVQKINPYADLLNHEFNLQLNGFNTSSDGFRGVSSKPGSTFIPSANVNFPESVDWRQVGAVTEVKNQGQCADCYAFAAASALEAQWFRKTGHQVDISEQNLMDCTESYGNLGCNGGKMNPAFQYVIDNGGVDSEAAYPYEEKKGECRFTRENVVVTCTGYIDIPSGDEKALQIAVATIGPVTAAIDARHASFQFYSDGIYNDPKCGNKPEQMNHAVLIVGYGQDPDGRKYWLVKNSYGPQWGIGGYIKMARDNGNQCGIALAASYPLV